MPPQLGLPATDVYQCHVDRFSIKDFGHKARLALRKVQAVYPDLGIQFEKGSVRVLPCHPAVTIKPKSSKK